MFRINDSIKVQDKEYVISKFLGRGGMAHVFLIEEKNGSARFALKYLEHFIPDDDYHRSLINEWEKAQKITHKNVIRYHGFHDGLIDPKTPYIVMELAQDGSLEEYLKSQTVLPDEQTCMGIFHQIIDGMEAVNAVLVHRDIKPSNIFIERGIFKIADFGLSKIAQEKTRSRTFKGWGSEPYIAPEAYRLETNTIQMDMYSVGHVFFQIASGEHAYGTPTDWEVAHLTSVPALLTKINPKVSPKTASVINKMISKKPSSRYETWECVRSDLFNSVENVGEFKPLIDKILQKKILVDLETERALSARHIAEEEKNRKSNIINFQFKNEIINPLFEFIDNFNRISGLNSKMHLTEISRRGDLIYEIKFDRNAVKIWFHQIAESDSLKNISNDMWGKQRLQVVKPTLNGSPVLAWGGIECDDKTGLNIVLVSSNEDEYGNWHMLKNTSSGLGQHMGNRPDPFAFSNEELLQEIHHVGMMHIFNLEATPLDIKNVIDFISNAL
jgi:serine/threonine protein kinase